MHLIDFAYMVTSQYFNADRVLISSFGDWLHSADASSIQGSSQSECLRYSRGFSKEIMGAV